MVDTMGRRHRRRRRVSAWLIKILSPLAAFAVPFLWLHYHVRPVVIFWASLALLLYYLFAAPTTCGVVHSDGKGTCDENAYGVLRACWREAHKRKKRRRMLHRLRHPLTRPSPDTRAPIPRSTVRPTPVYPYAPPAQPSSIHVETVLSAVGVIISALALIISFVAWRFPVAG
jgi:hypothetical protein